MLTLLLQFSDRINTAAAQVIAAREASGATAASAAVLPGLVAAAAPSFAGIRQAVAKLPAAERAGLYDELNALTARNGPARRNASLAARVAGLVLHPKLGSATDDAILLYLLFWLLDQLVIADFVAMKQPFDLRNPSPDYWYQRTDTAGSHAFNTADGCYLVNSIPAIPKPSSGQALQYFNAEIYNSTQTSVQPRNVIVNLFPVDDPKTDPAHFWYDLFLNVPYSPATGLRFEAEVKASNPDGGSRGWGFWNTDVFPLSMQIAWFIQLQGQSGPGEKPLYPNGFYATVQNGLTVRSVPLAGVDIQAWHHYRIDVTAAAVEFFIDGQSVFAISDPAAIPSAPMAFHDWVDNAVFGFEGGVITHILQTTTLPRSNAMKNLRLSSLTS
ncbi:hypothetical protein [Ferrovibrio sp.]|uniref:hypothetical protein n=1 Tax=Ferrovibrio sp. TaxID=1917215 RepID=UPI003519D601